MYKILFFLHKNDDEDVEKFFKGSFLDKLNEITGAPINIATVESNLLLDQKYNLYCEISSASKEEMDKRYFHLLDRSENNLHYFTEDFKNSHNKELIFKDN